MGALPFKKAMTWVLVVRPSNGIEYQIYDGTERLKRRKKKKWKIAVLKDAGITVISNFVWWYITS